MEEILQVGVVTTTHGVRGEVKVYPTTDDAKRFKKLKEILLDTGKQKVRLEIEEVKFFKQMVILKFPKRIAGWQAATVPVRLSYGSHTHRWLPWSAHPPDCRSAHHPRHRPLHGLHQSILGRAAQRGQLSFHMVNIRDYTEDKHGKVDDYPYGGGAGMLMQAQPVYDAYRSVASEYESRHEGKIRTVYVTPQGKTFTQRLARELAGEEELVFLCGHYEGVDERVLEEIVTDYVSLGDYVLTGGELPAMVMIDAIARLIPGVLHNVCPGIIHMQQKAPLSAAYFLRQISAQQLNQMNIFTFPH